MMLMRTARRKVSEMVGGEVAFMMNSINSSWISLWWIRRSAFGCVWWRDYLRWSLRAHSSPSQQLNARLLSIALLRCETSFCPLNGWDLLNVSGDWRVESRTALCFCVFTNIFVLLCCAFYDEMLDGPFPHRKQVAIDERRWMAVRRLDPALSAVLGDEPRALLPPLLPRSHFQLDANRYVWRLFAKQFNRSLFSYRISRAIVAQTLAEFFSTLLQTKQWKSTEFCLQLPPGRLHSKQNSILNGISSSAMLIFRKFRDDFWNLFALNCSRLFACLWHEFHSFSSSPRHKT